MDDGVLAGQPEESRTGTLRDLALLFLKLGTVAFGGPAAHIAMMEDEVVRRRKWLTHDEFLDLLGATNLIPGPNSTEMAIHIGHRRAGWPGLLVAGSCFILPAVLIVLFVSWVYVRYKNLPQTDAILYGIKPVIIAIILQALWGLGRRSMKSWFLAGVGIVTAVASMMGVNEILLLFGAGILVALTREMFQKRNTTAMLAISGLPLAGAAAAAGSAFSLGILFLSFLKIGSVLFGSGYLLYAFLRADFVRRLGWLTESQLLDAVAVGQVTPGPVFTSATFIGYILHGLTGAAVATVGIFLPAFFFVAVSGPLVPRLRQSRIAGAFLDGVNVSSVALIVVVTWQLGREAIVDVPTLALAAVGALLLFRFRLNSTWLILAGGLLGWFVKMMK